VTDTISPTLPRPDEESEDRLDDRVEALGRDLDRYRLSRDTWTIIIFALAGLAAVASVVGISLALGDGGGGVPSVAPIQAELTEFGITLSAAQVGEGGSIEVHNGGTMAHDVAIRGTDIASPELGPGETATLDLGDLEPGAYELW
jgi:hypothetical protein